jgi:hypothetical protein
MLTPALDALLIVASRVNATVRWLWDLVIENTFERKAMLHSYTDPVAKLLTYSGVDERSPKEQWPDYRERGLTKEHIPDLIRMATDLDLHNLRRESPEVWAPLHAWRALAQLRAVEAVNPLVLLFEQLKDDDWLPEELPTVLSMIGPGAIPTLERFLADDGIEEIGRISVPACLVRMARDHPDARPLRRSAGQAVREIRNQRPGTEWISHYRFDRPRRDAGNRVDPASVLGKPSRPEHPR